MTRTWYPRMLGTLGIRGCWEDLVHKNAGGLDIQGYWVDLIHEVAGSISYTRMLGGLST